MTEPSPQFLEPVFVEPQTYDAAPTDEPPESTRIARRTQAPDPSSLPAAIVISGEALQDIDPEERADIAVALQQVLRARLGSEAVEATVAQAIMPLDEQLTADELRFAIGSSVRIMRGSLSQRAFAQQHGTSQSAVSEAETGLVVPELPTLKRLADETRRKLGLYIVSPPETDA